ARDGTSGRASLGPSEADHERKLVRGPAKPHVHAGVLGKSARLGLRLRARRAGELVRFYDRAEDIPRICIRSTCADDHIAAFGTIDKSHGDPLGNPILTRRPGSGVGNVAHSMAATWRSPVLLCTPRHARSFCRG